MSLGGQAELGKSPLPRHSEDLGGVFRFDQEVEALLPYRWVGKLQSHDRGVEVI